MKLIYKSLKLKKHRCTYCHKPTWPNKKNVVQCGICRNVFWIYKSATQELYK